MIGNQCINCGHVEVAESGLDACSSCGSFNLHRYGIAWTCSKCGSACDRQIWNTSDPGVYAFLSDCCKEPVTEGADRAQD